MRTKKVIRLKDHYPETRKVIKKMRDKCDNIKELYWQKLMEDIADNKVIKPLYKHKPLPKKKYWDKLCIKQKNY